MTAVHKLEQTPANQINQQVPLTFAQDITMERNRLCKIGIHALGALKARIMGAVHHVLEYVILATPFCTLVNYVESKLFNTYKETITKHPDTMLARMLTGEQAKRNEKGEYFFNRNPETYSAILEWYKTGLLRVPSLMK